MEYSPKESKKLVKVKLSLSQKNALKHNVLSYNINELETTPDSLLLLVILEQSQNSEFSKVSFQL